MGCLISKAQFDKVLRYIGYGVRRTARGWSAAANAVSRLRICAKACSSSLPFLPT